MVFKVLQVKRTQFQNLDCFTGSEALLEHRQIVAKDHAARPRNTERGAVLHGG